MISLAAFRWLRSVGATAIIFCLMAANLVGFVVGTDGVVDFCAELATDPRFLAKTFITMFSAANLMLAYDNV